MFRMQRDSILSIFFMVLSLTGQIALAHTGTVAQPVQKDHHSEPQPVATSLLSPPIQFEANQGQVDQQVKFLARGKGYNLFLTPTESVMVLTGRDASRVKGETGSDPTDVLVHELHAYKHSIVRMKLEGANSAPAIDGMEKLPGIVNYFIGNDPAKWRTKIPTYAKVHYKDAYPGIDLAYYGNQGKLEYDFIVAPGADPNQIKLAFEGASEIKVADSGDLVLTTVSGDVRVQKPIVYQLEQDGHKTLVAGNYLFSPNTSKAVGIQLAAYDHSKPVVIDPVIVYSSFIGGAGQDNATDVAVDSSGNAFAVGWGTSLTFPTLGTPYDSSFNGGNDIFIVKVSPAGTLLAWTYLGGPGNDNTPAITLDGAGNIWATGIAGGTFPTTPGALQSVYQGGGDAFISKLDNSLSSLLYSTLYGSAGSESSRSLAVDASGNIVHIAGSVGANSILPGVNANSVQPTYGGGAADGFVAKINIALAQIVYATYLGGSDRDEFVKVRVDAAGYTHVAGRSFSTNFPGALTSSIPALASFQSTYGGAIDAVAAKLNPTGTQLIYSTYLGGSVDDGAVGLALDSTGNAVIGGYTGSPTFPLAGTPFQTTLAGYDYFITKINSSGTGLIMSTLFGGNGNDPVGAVIALDQLDNIYLTGPTNSCRIPSQPDPLQANRCSLGPPYNHVPVAKLDAVGKNLLALAFFTAGSSAIGGGAGIAVDSQGNAYVAGVTRASDFTTQNPFQSTYGGGLEDGFIGKISFKPIANAGDDQSVSMATVVTLDGTGSSGGSLTYSWTQVPGGPTVALSGATTVHPTFTAPTVPLSGGTVTFELVVCEGTSSNCSDPDTVNVHITNVNRPPVAEAGPDQTVQEGSLVILNGSASYDPDVESITYAWLQMPGPLSVTLVSPNTATPSFTAPQVGAGGGAGGF